jgi:hypothetical protein
MWNGDLQYSQAYPDGADAHRGADATKLRLEGYRAERMAPARDGVR